MLLTDTGVIAIEAPKLLDYARRNLANLTSVLGVLPLYLLFENSGLMYWFALVIYCNVMDDLDGILAAKLDARSDFGARLDNVCDAISHSILMMVVGRMFGGICLAVSLVAIAMVIIRSVSRLDPNTVPGTGSPTNELVRHVFFLLLLSQQFDFSAVPFLVVAFGLHTITMSLPWKLPYMIRARTKSAYTIGLVNVALLVAWLIPSTLPVVALAFFATYLYSFGWALNARARVALVTDVGE